MHNQASTQISFPYNKPYTTKTPLESPYTAPPQVSLFFYPLFSNTFLSYSLLLNFTKAMLHEENKA